MAQLLRRWSAAALLQGLVWAVVMLLALALPLLRFQLDQRFHAGTLGSEARALAFVIGQRVAANPTMWSFETQRLETQLGHSLDTEDRDDRRVVLDSDEQLVAQAGGAAQLRWPVIEHREPLYDHGHLAGWVVAQRSLRAQLDTSALLAAASLLAGAGLALALTRLPLRRLRVVEDELAHKAYHDSLTGLYNREAFRRLLAEAVTLAARDQRRLAVMFIDLDRFKSINDSLGHDAGDDALRDAAARLRGGVRAGDVVARLSGDEFAVLLDAPAGDASQLAPLVLKRFEQPFVVGGRPWQLGCSVGVALYPDHAGDAERLLACADAAMLQAKSTGRGAGQLYERSLDALHERHAQIERDLRGALERDEFVLHFQPLLALAENRVTGVETLLRWQHPREGLVMPGDFIGVLESSGLIHAVGRWVLHAACGQMRQWLDRGVPLRRIAVNVSALQFGRAADFVEVVRSALDASGLPARHLQLELTESMLMADHAAALATLSELRALGVELAIDDFGTGYSSLAYLQHFPVQALKIDRSFVAGMLTNDSNRNIVKAIVQLAHSLKLSVTAEGVESMSQREALRALGADHCQGYAIGRPAPPDAIEPVVQRTRPLAVPR
ncbi:MAG: EAL domain-containing protein [Rubrivivax sp.]